MKTCSVCNKTLINENESMCETCGSKIKSLNNLLQNKVEKEEVPVVEHNNINYKVTKNFKNTGVLIEEEERIKRNKLILICLSLLLFLGLMLNVLLESSVMNGGNIKYTPEISNLKDNSNYIYDFNNEIKKKNKYDYVAYLKYSDDYKRIINNKDLLEINNNGIYINENKLRQLYDACKNLLIDTNKVVLISSSKDISGNSLYEFIYDAQKFNVFYDKDTISYISNGTNDKIFENGNVVKSVDEFLIPYDQMKEIVRISKSIINLIHIEPTISKYANLDDGKGNWIIFNRDGLITVLSHVKYVNGGKTIKDNFEINLTKTGNGYKLVNLIYDDVKSNKLIY